MAERGPSLSGATAIMASGTLVSRVLGFVRNALLVSAVAVNAFGANAYDVANRIPNALYAVLAAGVVNSVLVPQIVRAFRRPDGKRTVDRIVTIGLAISLIVTVVCTIAAPFIVRLYSSAEWSDAQRDLATAFAFLVIPQLFFYAAYTILGQVLNAREQFGPYMWAPVLNNIVAIGGLLAYLALYGAYDPANDAASDWSTGRILWLALPATIAMASQALILIWPLLRGGYRPKFVWRGPKGELATVRVVASWALAAVIVEQIGVALSIRVASAADPTGADPSIAGNAAYFNALMIYLVPHSLVTVSMLTALGTTIAKHWADDDREATRGDVARGLRLTAAFTFFATSALIVLAPMLARTLLPKLSVVQVESVAPVIVALALGMVPLGAMVLVKRVYFVLEDARGIFLIHIPMTLALVAVAYLGKWTLDAKWWTVAAALGLSVSNLVGLALRGGGLRSRLGSLRGRGIARVHWLAALAAVLAGAVGFALRIWVMPSVETASSNPVLIGGFTCLVVGLAMALVYGAVLKLAHVEEADTLIRRVTSRLRRNVR
ncbi:murein biosynthesis integral membrane protein MurJ [Demequina sp.]|uniref:murein biosynthesis integral membrane protein MurJ n=1 Tax=Demequina sp. TaxID=2050685 RepID=UPI003D11DAF2